MAMLDQYVPDPKERRWMEPRLAGLLGLVDLPAGEPDELFSAFRTLFERVAALGTTVLLFEDLHLADAGLLDFIEGIPEWSRDHPILVITLARPEILDRRPGWGVGRHSFLHVHLGPLPGDDMRQLVESVSPGAPRQVVEPLLEAAAGVPLYAVELVRMLIDDGRLIEEDGRFHLAGDLEEPWRCPNRSTRSSAPGSIASTRRPAPSSATPPSSGAPSPSRPWRRCTARSLPRWLSGCPN